MPRSRDRNATQKHRKAASRRIRGSAESGANTRELVLQAARNLLIEEGYASFSIRRVAEAAGITVGNLTYHFPSKNELVRELIGSLISQYAGVRERLYADVSAHPERRLETLIEWLMRDSASATTNRLFRELWAMALHDPVAARAIDDFYDGGIQSVAAMLRDEHPGLDAQAALELVHLIAAVGEGTSVLYGTRANRKVPIERLTKLVCEVIAQALDARLSASKPKGRRASSA